MTQLSMALLKCPLSTATICGSTACHTVCLSAPGGGGEKGGGAAARYHFGGDVLEVLVLALHRLQQVCLQDRRCVGSGAAPTNAGTAYGDGL